MITHSDERGVSNGSMRPLSRDDAQAILSEVSVEGERMGDAEPFHHGEAGGVGV